MEIHDYYNRISDEQRIAVDAAIEIFTDTLVEEGMVVTYGGGAERLAEAMAKYIYEAGVS